MPDLADHDGALFVIVQADGGDIYYRLDAQDPDASSGIGMQLMDGDDMMLDRVSMENARFHATSSTPNINCNYRLSDAP